MDNLNIKNRILQICYMFFFILSIKATYAETIKIAVDAAGWPPFVYEDPKTGKASGASFDILREILTRANLDFEIKFLPWKRCLILGANGDFDLVMDGTFSAERDKSFFFTEPFYTINSALYYSVKQHPQEPPKINQIEDYKNYSFCGLFGYNYTMYNIPNENIFSKSYVEEHRLKLLHAGRCDFLIGDIEILQGFEKMGIISLDKLKRIPIIGAEPKQFFMLLSRKKSSNIKLVDLINQGLENLKKDGTYQQIFKSYGIESNAEKVN